MDSVQNDISVLFEASKVQASTHSKQTKTQIFESILNSIQSGTNKSLSLDKSFISKETNQKKPLEVKSKDKLQLAKPSVQDKSPAKKEYKAKDSVDSNQDRPISNNVNEDQPTSLSSKPTSLSSKPSSQEPASPSEDGDTKQDHNTETTSKVETKNQENIEEQASKEVETDEELSSETLNVSSQVEVQETPVDEEIINIEDINEVQTLEGDELIADTDSSLDVEATPVTDDSAVLETPGTISTDSEMISTDSETVSVDSENIQKAEVTDFEIAELLQDVEALQSSPELRELAQRVLDTIEDYSNQDLAALGIENPERLKEIVKVLAAFTESPNQVDAKIFDNVEVKAALESIDTIIQKANDLTTGEVDISDLEIVEPKQLDLESEDLKSFDEEILETVEIESIELDETAESSKDLRSTDEIKKDLKMIREDNVKGDHLKEQKVKETVQDQEQKTVSTEKIETKDSELLKKSQSLVRTVNKVQVEQESTSQEIVKAQESGLSNESSLNNENSESESNQDNESILTLSKNLAKGKKSNQSDDGLTKFDQLLTKANLVSEKVVSKEVGLSVDGSKKVMLTKVVRHPGFQSSTKIVVKQIQDLTKLLNPPKVNRLTMALKPERLGEVRLEIKQINDVIKLSFEVENHAVKEIIEKNLSQLKDSMKLQNIDATEVEVNVKDERGESDSAKEEQDSKKQKNKKAFDMNQELQDSEELSIDDDYQINQYA
ncbi:MAG: flagellar hook-length control protein FliK [Candidatus Cloacimonetes bacterium]|nr:flagellar hook-length control protein FliK [Candidatus Cloacimonadota bacterium]